MACSCDWLSAATWGRPRAATSRVSSAAICASLIWASCRLLSAPTCCVVRPAMTLSLRLATVSGVSARICATLSAATSALCSAAAWSEVSAAS